MARTPDSAQVITASGFSLTGSIGAARYKRLHLSVFEIIPNFETKDCGQAGTVFLQFIVILYSAEIREILLF